MKEFLKRVIDKLRRSAVVFIATMLLAGGLVGGLQLHNRAGAEPARGGVEYFLKIDGIQGESTDKGHEAEIELTSYAWSKDAPGIQQTGTPAGGSGGAGKAQVRDIYFTTPVNKSSPKLMEAAANNKHINEAVLTARKAGEGQKNFLTIKLSDVRITSYKTTGQHGTAPVDEFSFAFAKVEFTYAPQKTDGSSGAPVTGIWDFRE